MKSFRRSAFISMIAAYLLIFTGGLVRVTGSGLGCPDWPRCYGSWIPPLIKAQLPQDIDPNSVNLTLAWIEYLNRLFGIALGILVVITALLAIKNARRFPRLLFPSLLAALLVAFLGWQGGQVVESELEPLYVSLHFLLALVVVGLLTYVTQQAWYIEHPRVPGLATYPVKARTWIFLLGIAAALQIILGTEVRSSLEIAAERLPLAKDRELLFAIGGIKYVHIFFGLIVAGITWIFGPALLKKAKNASQLVRQATWWCMLLTLVQIALGLGLVAVGVPALLQLFHLWIGALFIGSLLVLYSAVRT